MDLNFRPFPRSPPRQKLFLISPQNPRHEKFRARGNLNFIINDITLKMFLLMRNIGNENCITRIISAISLFLFSFKSSLSHSLSLPERINSRPYLFSRIFILLFTKQLFGKISATRHAFGGVSVSKAYQQYHLQLTLLRTIVSRYQRSVQTNEKKKKRQREGKKKGNERGDIERTR